MKTGPRLRVTLSLLPLLLAGCVAFRPLADLRLQRGWRAMEEKDYSLAIAEFQEAVQLDPTNADAYFNLGAAYKASGDLESAAKSLQDSVLRDPNSVRSLFELGEVYRLLDRLAQAIRAYSMAADLDPRNFDLQFRLATCYHQSGDLDRAADGYRKAITLDAHNAYARSNLGAVLAAQGKQYDAIKAYKESLECDAGQPIVLVNLATVYLNQERWNTAHLALEKAVELDPKLASAHERLGYCLWREGDLPGALASYKRAIDLDMHNAAAFAGYGVVNMTLYLNEPEKLELRDRAVEAWHTSLELNPNQPKLSELLAKYSPKQDRPRFDLEH